MKIVKIATFLKERKIKYKPTEANNSGLSRIEKIDFDGNVYLSPIQTKTDMILIKNGDLVISGINVEKGALAIYQGKEDVLASIHYSAYHFDPKQIDIIYLKWFLKSNIFKKLLQEQTGSGIKKEIKAKHLLPIEVSLPSLSVQKEIVGKILSVEKDVSTLTDEVKIQEKNVSSLRQSILQQAVEGKLCGQNPNDEPVSLLLEKIKTEKKKLIKGKKIKAQKLLPGITEEEKPFELPHGWEWCRLGELASLITSGSRDWAKYYSQSGAKFIRMGNLSRNSYNLKLDNIQRVTPPQNSEGSRTKLEEDDILLSITGEVGLLGLVPKDFGEAYINQHTALIRFSKIINIRFYANNMLTHLCQTQFNMPQRGIKNSFRLTDIEYIILPLPPLAEQQRIVEKVDSLMALCDELETEVQSTKKYASKLMGAVLQEAFNSSKQEEMKKNVIEFVLPRPQKEKHQWSAAARGSMKEGTWVDIINKANELFEEE